VAAFPEPEFAAEARQFAWSRGGQSVVYAEVERTRAPSVPASARGRNDDVTDQLGKWGLTLYALSVPQGHRARLASFSWARTITRMLPVDDYVALSPKGTAVALEAWRRVKGKWRANVVVLDLATGELRSVVAFPCPGGRYLAQFNELSWKGERIYFACANPARTWPPQPQPGESFMAAREIWSVREDGTGLRQETSGPNDDYAAPRPGGKELAFIREGALCLRQPDGQVRTLVKAERGKGLRGSCRGPVTWSPDGAQIAFIWFGRRSGAPAIWAGRVVPVPGPTRP
jgi:Tol biopolymer transport system component